MKTISIARALLVLAFCTLASLFVMKSSLSDESVSILLYATDEITIDKEGTLTGADIVSAGSVSIGKETALSGSISATGNVTLDKNVLVDGSVTAGGSVSSGRNSSVTGTVTQHSTTALPAFEFESFEVVDGTDDVSVGENDESTLASGSYGYVEVHEGGTLILSGGEYHFTYLDVSEDAQIQIDEPVIIYSAYGFDFGRESRTVLADELEASDLSLYTNCGNTSSSSATDDEDDDHSDSDHSDSDEDDHGDSSSDDDDDDHGDSDDDDSSDTTSQCVIGASATFRGIIRAPYGTLDIDQNAILSGNFAANSIVIGKESDVTWENSCIATSEICDDGTDQDCDGSDLSCNDADQDSDGYSINAGDCNDFSAAVSPGATETCDGVDNNCNGTIDEAVGSTFYADADIDGFGNAASTTTACSQPSGYVTNSTDCNDASASTNPTTAEVCDGVDNNCNGSVDEGVVATFYADTDGDGFGASTSSVQACTQPAGYVTDNTDCDDSNSAINPTAAEICDGIDNNCNDFIDDDDTSTDTTTMTAFYADADGDAFGDASVTLTRCTALEGYVSDSTDCNDANASVNPTAIEICDGIDNNCNSAADESLSSCVDGVPLDLPNDPTEVAPEISPAISTSVSSSTEFLYTGTDPIQTGVAEDTIDALRAAVVRGNVMADDGSPLYGVTISVLGHAEYGSTQSRIDGAFDLALNGGGLVTIVYQKDGYLEAQRQVDAPWQDYTWLPDVVLKALDTNATSIAIGSTEVQVAQGSLSSDDDGDRTATVLFPPATTAELVFDDDSTQTITEPMVVRATEYTVGANGVNAMPGGLPASSGYTYAVELSIDEAISAGANTVNFNQPVYFYVDNFLDFPIGGTVPVGYYNKTLGAWVPADNGVIIQVLGDTSGDGITEVSVSSTGAAASSATLASYGFTTEELTKLTELYAAGTELWRVGVTHFSSWDCNWPYVFSPDTRKPPLDHFDSSNDIEKFTDNSCLQAGSIIDCENQTLGENFAITGTPFALVYRSDRSTGRSSAYRVTLPLTDGTALPASFNSLKLDIKVAGQRHTYTSTSPGLNEEYSFTWDGLDGYGRRIIGPQTATINLAYYYDVTYSTPSAYLQSFAKFSSSTTAVSNVSRSEGVLEQTIKVNLVGALSSGSLGIGSFSLDIHHFYNPKTHELFFGDGERMSALDLPLTFKTFAGTGTTGHTGDSGVATAATLSSPKSVVTDAEGNVYIGEGYYIRKIDRAGIITTFAGTGATSNSGDDGLATSAGILSTDDLAIDANGNIYILQYSGCRIRKIDAATQIITTFAGTGTCGFSGDDGAATAAKLNFPSGIATDSQGNVYVADTSNYRIRKIDLNGIITTIGGTGFNSDTGDGGLASSARISYPVSIAVDHQDNIYVNGFLAGTGGRIRKITPDGKINTVISSTSQNTLAIKNLAFDSVDNLYIMDYRSSTQARFYKVDSSGNRTLFAGGGTQTSDFTPATNARFTSLQDFTFDPEDNVIVTDSTAHKVDQIARPLPGFTANDILIAATNGAEVYHFDQNGQHLETLNAMTGEPVYTFTYDSTSGYLTGITDGDGNITTIERDSMGDVTAIVAPHGQRTGLMLNANGELEQITNPNGEMVGLTYTNNLLATLTDAKGSTTTFSYDADGKLIADTNALGGFKTLARTESTNSFGVAVATAEGLTTHYTVTKNSDLTTTRTQTNPAGLTTTTQIGQDNSLSVTNTDGTIVTSTTTGDPRFGLQAPILKSQNITTPGGLANSTVLTRSVTTDTSGALVTQTDEVLVNGKTYTSTYDNTTRTSTVTSPTARTVSSVIDDQGRVLSSTVSGITPVNYTYTSGQLTQVAQGSRTTTLAYNPSGLLETATNTLGQTTQYAYDDNGQVTSETLADGRTISYAYDANGNLTSLTPPGKPAHSFDYTALDLTSGYTPPDIGLASNTTNYTYDLDKRLTLIMRPDGKTVAFDFDTSGRVASTIIDRGSYTYTYATTTGKLTSLTAPDGGAIAFTYDGSLPLSTTWTGTVAGSVSRTFNNDFNVATQSVNGSNTVTFTYDNDNLLTAVGDLTLTRDTENGLLNATTLASVATTYTYNDFAELSEASATTSLGTIFDTSYTRDDLGRITTKTENIYGTTATYGYTYDTTGRLTGVTRNSANLATYVYDDNGNRTAYTDEITATTTTGTYDDQDRLTSYGDNTFTYTDNGELLTKTDTTGTTTYSYDELGNLLSATLPDATLIEYVIDGQDRRIGRKVNGSLEKGFLYDDQLRIVAELDAFGNVASRFVYATKSNVPDYMVQGTTTYRIISDHLGSPRLVLNASTGDLVQQMDYDEFGRVTNDTSPGFQPFGFAGGLYDASTGLVRFGARDYDAEIGRWTSKDPIGFAGGDSNLFGYVLNDPVNLVDYFGLSPQDIQSVYDWIQVHHPEIANGLNPTFIEVNMPGSNSGMTLPDQVILIDRNYDNLPNLADTVAHELLHTKEGFWGTIWNSIKTNGQSHKNIYEQSAQIWLEYKDWLSKTKCP